MLKRTYNDIYTLADWTEEIVNVPNDFGTIGQLGIFSEEPVAASSIIFEEVSESGGLIIDRVRGERNSVNKNATRKAHAILVPHFPLDDAILPKDLAGKRAYGNSLDEADTLAGIRVRKMQEIRRKHAWTLEFARAQILTSGTVYAPSGTVTQNWFTEFGVTQTTVDFLLGTGTTNVLAKIETALRAIRLNIGNGGRYNGVIGLASPEFFSKLTQHASVVAAYSNYSSFQEPLRNRLAPGNTPLGPRQFEYGGVTFYELVDNYNGTQLIPANDCVFIPTGSDSFKTFFAPCEKFGLVNTLGEQVYMFEFPDDRGNKIEIETESNFVNAAFRPQVIIRGYTSN